VKFPTLQPFIWDLEQTVCAGLKKARSRGERRRGKLALNMLIKGDSFLNTLLPSFHLLKR